MMPNDAFYPPGTGGLSIKEQVQETGENGFVCQHSRRPFLMGMNEHYKLALFFKPRCKSWECPACGEMNKRMWAVKTFQGASKLTANGQSINFLTITMHERTRGTYALKIWPKAWKKLRERAAYASGGFQYVLIPEQHKDGTMHVHAIETAALGERWWKDNARQCGLGYMAEEEEIRTPEGAAWYVTKYLTKSISNLTWPKGFRRIRTSQRWPKSVAEQVQGWEFKVIPQEEQLSDVVEGLKSQGWKIENRNHKTGWMYIYQMQELIDTLEGSD